MALPNIFNLSSQEVEKFKYNKMHEWDLWQRNAFDSFVISRDSFFIVLSPLSSGMVPGIMFGVTVIEHSCMLLL